MRPSGEAGGGRGGGCLFTEHVPHPQGAERAAPGLPRAAGFPRAVPREDREEGERGSGKNDPERGAAAGPGTPPRG